MIRKRPLFLLVFVLALAMIAAPKGLRAEETAPIFPPAPASSEPKEKADSKVARSAPESSGSLKDRGIAYTFSYTADAFTKLRGGITQRRGGEVLGSFQTSMSADLAKMKLGRGQLMFSAQNTHGRGISDSRVGGVQAASNLDTQPFSRVMEAWYSDSYFEDKLTIKGGRLFGDADFNGVQNGANFLNASYGQIPTVPLPSYPLPELGLAVWVAPTPWISWGVGVFRGVMLDPLSPTGNALRQGPVALLETKLEPMPKAWSQAAIVRIGLWQQTGGTWLLSPTAVQTDPVRNYGLYASGDYWFRKKSDEERGPGLFFQSGWAPADRNEIIRYLGGGFAYPGVISRRPNDAAGIGVSQAKLSAGGAETVMELFYKLQINRRFMVQPDLQWVHKAAGTGPNALVGGIRLKMEL